MEGELVPHIATNKLTNSEYAKKKLTPNVKGETMIRISYKIIALMTVTGEIVEILTLKYIICKGDNDTLSTSTHGRNRNKKSKTHNNNRKNDAAEDRFQRL